MEACSRSPAAKPSNKINMKIINYGDLDINQTCREFSRANGAQFL